MQEVVLIFQNKAYCTMAGAPMNAKQIQSRISCDTASLRVSFVLSPLIVIGLLISGPCLQGQTASNGLVAAYAFNEGTGTTTTDTSGNTNTGSLTSTTWTTSGKFGNALTFNGTSSRANVNDAASLDLTNGMTLEAWVYPTTGTGWRTVILKEKSGGLTYGLYANSSSARPGIYINTGGSDISVAGTTTLSLNTWSHLAATYDGATLKLYVNGVQAGSRSTTGNMQVSTSSLRIGGNTIWGEYFKGRIDEVRIYSRALTQAEIQADMNAAISGDSAAPTVTAFAIPSTAAILTIPITAFTATDNIAVTGYLVTESATTPTASATGWSATAPASYTVATAGTKTLYAWAKDAAGNISASKSATVAVSISDTTAPTVTAFTVPSTASSLTISISSFTAIDNVTVTGYLITESASAPAASASGWSSTAPTSYTVLSEGAKTLYAWAKDAANNVSSSKSATVTVSVSDTTSPTVIGFTIPATSNTLTVPINSFSAQDNVAVTGFLVNESATKPSASATGWSASAPTSYTFPTSGSKTLYAWAKDAAGNVSASLSASVTISVSDTTAPLVTAFVLPSTATSLTVGITSFTASDNVAVTGFLVNESSTKPSATAAGWVSSAPASYTFSSAGTKTLYAWAKDAAGNVSASMNDSVAITIQSAGVEPAGWFAGDPHVHRSCGSSPEAVSSLYSKMNPNDLTVISLLADMGNAEVQNATTDLPLVNGSDASISTSGRKVHWDAEWHWDAIYSQYAHQALGGHVLALGLTEAHQIWQEYTYPIFQWAHQQNGIAGFAHMQYLDNGLPQNLTCCTPIEYPVEVALGAADFISEDVNGSESAINAYYRLLNTGFRPGFAAGTDYPCGVSELGSLLTYVQVAGGQMTYRNWISGIAQGRTVISRNGHNEFLNLVVNNTATPGDEIKLTGGGSLPVTVTWTASQSLSGTIELVMNGSVLATLQASVSAGSPATLTANVSFSKSGWLAARRMTGGEHQVHTSAVFVIVDNLPIRVSVGDAQFYVDWMDNLLQKTSPGGEWSGFFPTSRSAAQARYAAAKTLFQQIAAEAGGTPTIPSVTTVTPANGATAVIPNATVTAGFSKAMDQTTITNSTFTLRDSAGTLIPATVTYSTGTLTATLTPSATLSYSTNYTATISTAIKDSTGVPLAANYAWSFTTASQSQGNTYTIWSAAAVPAVVSDTDTSAVELGVKFRSSLNGLISGIRFYKSTANTGTHVGNLWTSTGTLLASATFAGETASGWQQVNFATPVAITANTIYVASYHTNVGHYSGDTSYFGSSIINGPLEAVANTVSANGVYLYGTGGFPNQSWNASNYWVDIAFTTGTTPPDTTPPTVTSVAPANGATGIATGTSVTVAFSEAMDSSTISASTFELRNPSNTLIPATVSYNSSTTMATLTPSAALANSTVYTATIKGGATDPRAKDVAGNALTANYVFSFTTAAVADSVPPAVTSVTPVNGATGVTPNTTVTALFSEAIDSSTISASTFELRNPSNTLISATVSYNSSTTMTTLTPSAALANSTVYTATIKGGATDPRVKDVAGNALAANYTWSFTTSSAMATDPILLITSTANPFSNYYAEILKTEGFNYAKSVDLSALNAATLAGYDLALLGETPLSSAQVSMLTQWVNSGGKLIAMRPDKQLAGFLGLADRQSTLSNAYLSANTAQAPGKGIVGDTIQFHGTADLYNLNGASQIATLYSDANTATSSPAVTISNVGSGGGQTAAFTYDLAKSVIYTRQGNPDWAGLERDGAPPVRADDMFYPDWIDLGKVAIPQADEQQRLLANLIISMESSRKPIPRFWYFPRDLGAVVVMTGDDHAGGGTAGRFDTYLANSPSGCSLVDWECIRSTSYLFVGSPLSNSQAVAYQNLGFEVSLHLNTGCSDWDPYSLQSALDTQYSQFIAQYPGVSAPVTHRTHCIVWSDYTSMAEQELAHGMRLDTNYYYWPPEWIQNRPGFFTGSGFPMRFAKSNGTILDAYQAATQLTDESGQTYPYTINTLLDKAIGAEGYYGVFLANMHTDYVQSDGSASIIASAQARNIPVLSARQILQWLDAREASRFDLIAWDGNNLTFTLSAAPGATGLRVLVPIPAGRQVNQITLNGSPVAYGTSIIKGINYVFFQASSGACRLEFQ
jgi:hypothetical protein